MYKQASQLKLRVSTTKGNLSVEQLWDLSKDELASIAKKLSKILKSSDPSNDADLAFLSEQKDPAKAENELRFNIVKDIYLTKVAAEKDSADAAAKRLKNQRIIELIARKQEAELEGKSIEELQAMLED